MIAVKLAACLVFRNAAPYLREWLLFHLAVGFERFFLYNNDSTDDFATVLEPFRARRATDEPPVVELIAWPGYYQQEPIYNDCLRRAAEVPWLAFIDDDEFLYPNTDEELPRVLDSYRDFAGVAVCWRLYGSSGRIYREDAPVLERFTKRAKLADPHVKCIVQPSRVLRAVCGGHQFAPKPGYAVVDETGLPLDAPFSPRPSAERLRVNHYVVKSIEELVVRRTSRDIGHGDQAKLSLTDWLRLDRQWNETEDASATRFAPRMRELGHGFDILCHV